MERGVAAEGIPPGEQGPAGVAFSLFNRAVGSGEPPVAIREDARIDVCVVQGGIEYPLLGRGATGYPYLPEGPAPFVQGSSPHGIESSDASLSLIILPGPLGIHERKTDFHFNLLAFGSGELGENTYAGPFARVFPPDYFGGIEKFHVGFAVAVLVLPPHPLRHRGLPKAPFLHRLVKDGVEIQVIGVAGGSVAPASFIRGVSHVAGHGAVIQDFDFLPSRRSGDSESEVALHSGKLVFREGEPQGSAMLGGRTLGADAVPVQGDRVVSGRGFLGVRLVGRKETWMAAVGHAVACAEGAVRRHREKVAELCPPSGAARAHEGKPGDGSVVGAVAGRGTVDVAGHGSDVHHPEGSKGPRSASGC